MSEWNISEESICALNELSSSIGEWVEGLNQESSRLMTCLEEQDGLGYHSDEIKALIENIQRAFIETNKNTVRLRAKIAKASNIRRMHREDAFGVSHSDTNLKQIESYSNNTNQILSTSLNSAVCSDKGTNISHLQPVRSIPRDLSETEYTFTRNEEGNLVYDSPKEMANYLYSDQGSAYEDFGGTCGLCSIANVLRLAGVNATEKEIIDCAKEKGLCEYNDGDRGGNGGTDSRNRKEILECFGIESVCIKPDIKKGQLSEAGVDMLADAVSQGRGVIISVYAGRLNPQLYGYGNEGGHAVTLVSVEKNKEGKVLGFYVCDSNCGTSFFSVDNIRYAVRPSDFNITSTHIR